MLVLSRKESETIVIGDNVMVTVKEIKGNRVRLSIEAPRHVRVKRVELKGEPGDENSQTTN